MPCAAGNAHTVRRMQCRKQWQTASRWPDFQYGSTALLIALWAGKLDVTMHLQAMADHHKRRKLRCHAQRALLHVCYMPVSPAEVNNVSKFACRYDLPALSSLLYNT